MGLKPLTEETGIETEAPKFNDSGVSAGAVGSSNRGSADPHKVGVRELSLRTMAPSEPKIRWWPRRLFLKLNFEVDVDWEADAEKHGRLNYD